MNYPQLQIWRRNISGDVYDKIASTELTAIAESPNRLYSVMIDSPLQFQSGDLLGMFLPREGGGNGRLRVLFGQNAGPTYRFTDSSASLTSLSVAGGSDNDRPFLAVEISEHTPTTAVYNYNEAVLSIIIGTISPTVTMTPQPTSDQGPTTTVSATVTATVATVPDPTIPSSGNNTVAIGVGIAIAFAVVIGLVLAVILIVVLYLRRRKREPAKVATQQPGVSMDNATYETSGMSYNYIIMQK